MINILPPNYRDGIHYGRLNASLRHWIIAAFIALGCLLLILGAGALYMNQQEGNLRKSIRSSESQIDSQDLLKVKKQAQEINTNVKTITKVLSREILFSKLIQDIGTVMPDNTVLGSLTLNKVSGAIDLSASAKNYKAAAQIAANLSDPKNNIFDKVDIINVSCATTKTEYPCSGTYKALFGTNTPSRFLNVPKGEN